MDQAQVGAAIDVGSNSVHLLVAERSGEALRVIRDESVLLGLWAMVDIAGYLPEDGQTAVIDAVEAYAEVADEEGAEWVTLLGTEPFRRASNRSQVGAAVAAATGLTLHSLSHEEEATLTVLGVLAGRSVEEPLLVLDIGGGSTELVLLEPGADPVVGVMPTGSARLTAGHVEDDPPTAEEVAVLRHEAHHLVSGLPAGHPKRGIVVGGSGTNLVRLTGSEGDEDAADPEVIDRARIARAIDIVRSLPSDELAAIYGLRPGRILQMAAGASLIEAVLDVYNLPHLEASEASLREGAIRARSLAGDAWRETLVDALRGPTARI